jgi:hypothetical protein
MESQNMESGLPIRESRWHRPNLYHTIVSIYLLCNGIFVAVGGIVDYNHWFLAGLSIFGAILLLKRKKGGTIVSFFALFALVCSQFFMKFLSGNLSFSSSMLIEYSEIVMGFFVFGLLALGLKSDYGFEEKILKWKRPNIYATIVSVYVLIVGLIPLAAVLFFMYGIAQNMQACGDNCPSGGTFFGMLFTLSGFVIFGILGVFSILSSILLWWHDRNGITSSIFVLGFMVLIFSYFSLWGGGYVIGLPLLASTTLALVFLMKARKNAQWRGDSIFTDYR